MLIERQVAYWTVMSAIGSKIGETPKIWWKYEIVWILTSWLLLAITFVMAFMQSILSIWVMMLIILVVDRLLTMHAQKRACKRYRNLLRNLIGHMKEMGEETEMLEKNLLLTDQELITKARQRVRMGIVD